MGNRTPIWRIADWIPRWHGRIAVLIRKVSILRKLSFSVSPPLLLLVLTNGADSDALDQVKFWFSSNTCILQCVFFHSVFVNSLCLLSAA
ncbi:hypothetical protein CW304_26265 [Bacillus sp. UFRGS-B20]|nr:hypothetical protein CW304_26265 [Bacillus sp. UFRGS-B20]